MEQHAFNIAKDGRGTLILTTEYKRKRFMHRILMYRMWERRRMVEGATEKVSQFVMPVKSVKNKNICFYE